MFHCHLRRTPTTGAPAAPLQTQTCTPLSAAGNHPLSDRKSRNAFVAAVLGAALLLAFHRTEARSFFSVVSQPPSEIALGARPLEQTPPPLNAPAKIRSQRVGGVQQPAARVILDGEIRLNGATPAEVFALNPCPCPNGESGVEILVRPFNGHSWGHHLLSVVQATSFDFEVGQQVFLVGRDSHLRVVSQPPFAPHPTANSTVPETTEGPGRLATPHSSEPVPPLGM